MSGDERIKTSRAPQAPEDGKAGSGEGADTALQALIKKRKMQADDRADAGNSPVSPGPSQRDAV